MKTCVVRLFGLPDVANVTKPRLLLCVTASSWMFRSHFVCTAGSPLHPELHHEAWYDSKITALVVVSVLHELIETLGPDGSPVAMDFDRVVAC